METTLSEPLEGEYIPPGEENPVNPEWQDPEPEEQGDPYPTYPRYLGFFLVGFIALAIAGIPSLALAIFTSLSKFAATAIGTVILAGIIGLVIWAAWVEVDAQWRAEVLLFGRLCRELKPGVNLVLPFIEKLRFVPQERLALPLASWWNRMGVLTAHKLVWVPGISKKGKAIWVLEERRKVIAGLEVTANTTIGNDRRNIHQYVTNAPEAVFEMVWEGRKVRPIPKEEIEFILGEMIGPQILDVLRAYAPVFDWMELQMQRAELGPPTVEYLRSQPGNTFDLLGFDATELVFPHVELPEDVKLALNAAEAANANYRSTVKDAQAQAEAIRILAQANADQVHMETLAEVHLSLIHI